MKLHTALILCSLGATALPSQAAQFEEYGRVIRAQPRVEQIRQPREECRTEYVPVPHQQRGYQQPQRNAGGAILGAIAGGVIGNQVGGGSGRAAATAIGAVAGAMAGDRISNNGQPVDDRRYGRQDERYNDYPQEQAIRQCRTVDAWESRTTGYDVTYDYRGRSYTTFTQRDPGERIRLRVTVEPDVY
ncbi:glycine zipper 2TM domain-containing protein [Massilia sp. PAMC28688]|uniref:glycine zipper 2TM domain-containing protein n=1 Tax=Massilia sp. PAMC28688 TaxID=2861283 RepID=UPI001C624FC8|nr:glycine zipper 2TM domain-containing protein [Massilia sp. PAMC28688]QYF91906.1 glycine zipper 2TM domain-containing protein [Massilia sp. PAMC28688]